MTDGPLTGLRVVELAGIGPGPFACNYLEDLGATVIRIERSGGSNALPDAMASIGRRPRTTLYLNLKDEGDRSIATTVIRHADVLIEGFRPGVAERLGIGPERMCEENPRLVYGRLTGWGQDGPYAQMAGHDINYIGLSGALAAIGTPDMPIPPLNLLGDYGGGAMFVIVGVLAALFERSSTGSGQVVDVAMVDGVATLMGPIRDLANAGLWSEERRANFLDGGSPFYTCYRTADDRYVAVGALEPQFFSVLVAGLGLDEAKLGDRLDRTAWPGLRQLFAECFQQRTRDEWMDIFDGTDGCVTPVLSLGEVGTHHHNQARRALRDGDSGPVPTTAPRFEGMAPEQRRRDLDLDGVSELLVDMGLEPSLVDDLTAKAIIRWT